MAQTQKIKLYRIRGFSQKLNATIEFIRQNVKPLGKSIIYIMGPLAILNGLLSAQYIDFMFGNIGNQDALTSAQNPLSLVTSSTYIGFIFLSSLSILLNYAIIINYLRLYDERYPEKITATDVLNVSWRDVLPLFILAIITGVLIILGTLVFIIPGVYLAIVLSLAMPAYMFERKGIMESIGRSFRLIRGKWWSTFGLMFVAGMIMYVISMLFIMPFYLFYFLAVFTQLTDSGVTTDISSFWFKTGMTLSAIFMSLGTYLAYCIPVTALSFQYFNLVERQESVGLVGEIEQLEE